MFAYVSALRPNVYFKGTNLIFGFLILWACIMFGFSNLFFSDLTIVNDSFFLRLRFKTSSIGEKFISPACVSIIVSLGVILLLNLLAVVKICYYQQGPLREHFLKGV
jgi:hypothetical protein